MFKSLVILDDFDDIRKYTKMVKKISQVLLESVPKINALSGKGIIKKTKFQEKVMLGTYSDIHR